MWCQCACVWCQSVWCQPVWCQAVWCQSVWFQSVWCQPVWCQSVWCEAVWRQSLWCQSVRCQAMWCQCACVCDVNLCGVCLCDVNLCDVNLCDVKLCDVNLCDVNLCDVKLCDVSVRVCDVDLCGVCLCDVNLCNANLCAQLPQTQFTHSKAPNPHASKTSTQNFRTSYWHSYPKRNLHTARRQTRMPARHPHKIFAPPIGTATPNAIYTQQGAKPACQQDIHTKFSHLLLAQLPQTQFTHSKAPNPHASKTSAQNFRTSYWHSYPKRNLHTARRQTRMPARHPHKIFAPPIGTATPNAIYRQQGAKPACQQDIHTKFSHLLLAQLPQTQFTHSKAPNPHASKTSTQIFRTSYWHSYPKRNLHTARRQTRMPARHPHKIFAPPIGTATPNAIYTQQAAKPACQEDIHTKFSHLLLAQLPRTTFTHSKAPNPNAGNTSTQNFRSSKSHAQALQVPQKQRQSDGAQNAPKRTSDPVRALQVPRLRRKSSGRAAEPKTRQSVHQTPGKRSKHQACHAKAAAEWRSQKRAKAYIRPRASAPRPTPATQKQRQSGGAQNAPKRTSDPAQVLQVPRLPRKSSGRAAEPKTRQSVHRAPPKCSKSHACHAKAAAERRSPKRAKAYIRPRASAPSPTPATQKQRQSGGAQNAPKRTSDPAQVLQVPRLPRKSSGKAAGPKTRQSVHQTPRKCSKAHACHAKALGWSGFYYWFNIVTNKC